MSKQGALDELQAAFDILTEWLLDRDEDDDGNQIFFEDVDPEIDEARGHIADAMAEIQE